MKAIRLILAATLMLASGMAMAGEGVAYGYGPYGYGLGGPCDDPPCGGGPELATDTLDPIDTQRAEPNGPSGPHEGDGYGYGHGLGDGWGDFDVADGAGIGSEYITPRMLQFRLQQTR